MTRCLEMLALAVVLVVSWMPATALADCQDRPPWVAGAPCLSIQPVPTPTPLPMPVTPLPDTGVSAVPFLRPWNSAGAPSGRHRPLRSAVGLSTATPAASLLFRVGLHPTY